jgi:hypothetical protein
MVDNSVVAVELSEDQNSAARLAAILYNVVPNIHPNDHLFAYCLKQCQTVNDCVNAYFGGGCHDGKKVKDLVEKLGLAPGAQVLEFAAGYGRVTRLRRRRRP